MVLQSCEKKREASRAHKDKGMSFFRMPFIKGGRLTGYLLAFLLLIFYTPAALAALMATWSCTPGAGQEVQMGDTIAYMLVVQTADEGEDVVALRVQLGKGMRMEAGVTLQNEEGEKEIPSQELALDRDGLGFVLMTASLAKGDRISFQAAVTQPDAEVLATASIGDFRAEVAHDLAPFAPEAIAPFNPEDALGPERPEDFLQTPVKSGASMATRIVLLIGFLLALAFAGWKLAGMLRKTA